MREKYNNIEDILDAFVSVLKDNFNADITAYNDLRNSDKNTEIEISTVEADDYYDTLDQNSNASCFMMYGVSSVSPLQIGQGGSDLQKPNSELHFIYAYETAGEITQVRKMLRIQEILEQIMAKKATLLIKNDFSITRTDPLTLQDDSGNYLKACGLLVTVDV